MLSWRPPGSPGVVRYRQGPGQQEPQSHVQPGTMRANVPIRDGTPDSPGQQTLRQPRQTRGQRVIVAPGGGLDTGTGLAVCVTGGEIVMNAKRRVITTTLSAAIAGMLFIPAASACGYPTQPQSSLTTQQLRLDPQNPLEAVSSAGLARDQSAASHGSSVSIVGMWNIQFISMGNTMHTPGIPDGAQIDFGYGQWHSDGTEFFNSGGRAPATQNFCLGVWQQTGRYTYVLNHFALSYDATTGLLNGKVNI